MMKKTILSLSIIFLMQSTYAIENDEKSENLQAADLSSSRLYSFDANSLFGGSSRDINLNQFTKSNTIASGRYSLNTSVNNRPLGQLTLDFKHLDTSQGAVLCIDENILQRLDLRKEIIAQLKRQDCLTIKDLSPEAYYDVDRSELTLNISLPLTITNNRPQGYIAPELFDKGVTSGLSIMISIIIIIK